MIDTDVERPVETSTPRGDAWVKVPGYRLVARLTDYIIAIVIGFTVVVVFSVAQYFGLLTGWTWLEDGASDLRIPIALAAVVATHLYNAVHLVATRGSSIGKRQVGLGVFSTDGGTVGYGQAFVRELLALPGVTALPVLTGEGRGIHDLAGGTRVWSTDASQPPGIQRDVRVYQIVGQVVAVAVVGLALRWLFGNLFENLDEQNIGTDFGFLDGPTNFEIPFDTGFESRSPVRSMVWIGVKNTLLSSVVGIAIAFVLGVVIGVARLSTNWLVAKLATLYVETLRNIPPLVLIIFFGAAVFTNGSFPVISGTSRPWTYEVPGSDSMWLIVSKTVWGIPSLAADGNTAAFWAIAVLALAVAIAVWTWRTKVNVDTGAPHHRVLWSLGVFVAICAVAWVALDAPYRWSFPNISENGRRIENGFVANFGYISVTIALGLYTASHIAEIVRGSILAVPKGQSEAGNALALSGFQRYRFVILPQAMRIAVPPIINQFLNLTKNTSLGIAVAYAELTALTKSSIGNGRPAVQSLAILISLYLVFSITISVVMNYLNARLQLEDR